MGRIADALRRAEQERRETVGEPPASSAGPATATVEAPPKPPEEVVDYPPDSAERGVRVSGTNGLSESLVPFFEPSSLVTEQYRSLRTRLLSQNPHYEHRIMAITSAVPKEGKSVTTLNLGCILAEIRHLKILVVDGDFRRSSLAQMLDQENGPGLADVLAGEARYEDVIRSTSIKNLKFISAGRTQGRSAAALLTAASAKPIFRRMRNDFHYTIVDTPPATTVTDVGIIGQMCTGVIVIVRLHKTHEAAARRAVRLLQVNNIPILGCMVIGRDAPVDQYGYGYGYGYGYYKNYHRYYDYIKGDSGKS